MSFQLPHVIHDYVNEQNNNNIYINEQLNIPESEISFQFTTSGGPGGQHANKAATKAILLFDVANSLALIRSLSVGQHQRLIKKLESRMDSDGILQVAAQDTRSQHQNRQIAVERFQAIMQKALKKKKRRIKTRPSRAANERRIQNKKRRGQKKQERGRDWSDRY